ncbi:MAG: hypothetical protein IT456_11410 [Planctomycetes bacterium]|nr:hypothetical protein [Planctomycetota bacterium]
MTFTCQVKTKNAEDSDSAATSIGAAFAITTTVGATTTAVRTGCKELVRYEFSAKGTGSDQWIHFRSNSPLWETN